MLGPLVKWAGGKRQILREIVNRLPLEWNTYYEPFLGGGALLFELLKSGRIERAVVSDLNHELINMYRCVQRAPTRVADELDPLRNCLDRESYISFRTEFNALSMTHGSPYRRAALFLYLNRTGFNGLWRVNSRGEFNVPFGDYRKLVLPRASGLEEVSHLLGPVKFMELDFAETLRDAVMGDFAYLDPPYIPVSRSSSFTQYTSGGFGMNDQERLRDLCLALKQRGVRFILSNSDVPEIWRIYSDFSHEVIEARRSINSIPVGRKGHTECIITSVG